MAEKLVGFELRKGRCMAGKIRPISGLRFRISPVRLLPLSFAKLTPSALKHGK
nr:hypothetical protein [uncultured Blautia sp.]